MALFDFPLDTLQRYLPNREEPEDFDTFWVTTLAEARQFPIDACFEPVEAYLETVSAFDVTFNGFGGQPIKGWFLLPRHLPRPLPCVVEYLGYGGGRGQPFEWLTYSAAGYAHLVMDTRGQGGPWRLGSTPDIALSDLGPQVPGFMTRGITSPESYYYRRVFTDAVRAVEAAMTHHDIDAQRIAIVGGSQGGGITLAVSALEPRVKLAIPEVPFLCHYRRAVELVDTDPYHEIGRYLKLQPAQEDTVYRTLSYFDGLNFATRAHMPALFSAGLMDGITPPSTIFAAYNHYAGPKEIRVWKYSEHDGGSSNQTAERLRFLKQLVG